MGAPSTVNVASGKPNKVTGGVSYAPLGTALPTDASTALAAAYKPMAYISDGGVAPSRSISTDSIKAWGGDTVMKVETENEVGFDFTCIAAFDADVLRMAFGTANVTVTAATASTGTKIAVQDKGEQPAAGVYVFELLHAGKKRRSVVPVGQPTITGESEWTDGSPQGFDVSLSALPDASGVRVYHYFENTDKTA